MAALAWVLLSVPALFVFIRGRQLLPRKGESTFPDLHFKKAQTSGLVLGGCLGVVLVQSPDFFLLKMGWLLLSLAVADYPYRKALHGFSQGLLPYLSFSIRMAMALHGHVFLLVCIPGVVELWQKVAFRYGLGDGSTVVAVTVALLSIMAMHWVPWRFKWCVRARPLMQQRLDSHFFGMVQGATCRVPEIRHFGPKSGFYLNAHALPSLYRPLVVLSDDLLSTLGPREVGAVFAHELAHLEEATPKRRILHELGFVALALFGVLAVWGTSQLSPGLLPYLAWAWPMFLILSRNWIATSQQRQEHRSDLRAVELSGDAQTTIDALNKIHLFNYLPRRWSGDDTSLSHPSLANRLRAIQEAAPPETSSKSPPLPPAPLPDLVVRGVQEPSTVVVLGQDRMHWLSDVSMQAGMNPKVVYDLAPQRSTMLYRDLADLRLVAKWGQRLWLTARDGDGERLLRLSNDDASAVQRHLEQIDHQLQGTAVEQAPVASESGFKTGHLRLNGFLVAGLGLFSTWSWPLIVVGLLVLMTPSTTALAAAGAVTIGSQIAALALGKVDFQLGLGENLALLNVLCLGFMGMLFLSTAMKRYRFRAREAGWTLWLPLFILGFLGFLSLLWGALRFVLPSPRWFLHLWARDMPFVVPACLALVVALCFLRRPWARPLAVGVGLLGFAATLLGTSWARQHWVQDPLAALGPRFDMSEQVVEVPAERSSEEKAWPGWVRWSPSGKLAVQVDDYDSAEAGEPDSGEYQSGDDFLQEGLAIPFVVELGNGHRATWEAENLLWLDDNHLLLMTHGADHTTLSSLTLVPSTEDPVEITLPRLMLPTLLGSEEMGGWQLTGLARDAGGVDPTGAVRLSEAADEIDSAGETDGPQIVLSFRGHWPKGEVEHRQLVLPEDPSTYYEWIMGTDGALLKHHDLDEAAEFSWKTLFFGFFEYFGRQELSWKSVEGSVGRHSALLTTALGAECLPSPSPDLPVLCWVDDGRFTTLWQMGPQISDIQVLGHVDCSLAEVFYTHGGVFFRIDELELWQLDLESTAARRFRLVRQGDDAAASLEHSQEQGDEELEDGAPSGWLEGFLEAQMGGWYDVSTLTVDGRQVTLSSSESIDVGSVDIELFRLPGEPTETASIPP